jgi:anti-sigma B factor antagonist
MSETDGGDLLEREDIGDATVVRLNVPRLLDDETTNDLFRQIYSIIDEEGRRKLVLNLQPLEYFASAALSKLVVLYRKARAAEARVALCNVTPTVASILQVTHLADIMIAYNDEREALRSF